MSDLWARATAAVEDQIYGEITNWQEKVKVNEWLGAGILRITRELRKLIFTFTAFGTLKAPSGFSFCFSQLTHPHLSLFFQVQSPLASSFFTFFGFPRPTNPINSLSQAMKQLHKQSSVNHRRDEEIPTSQSPPYSPKTLKHPRSLPRSINYLFKEQRLLFILVGILIGSTFFIVQPNQISIPYPQSNGAGKVGRIPVGIGRRRLRIVVTGGAGFVGSHLVDKLIARGDDVIVIDNFFTGRKENVMHHFGNPRFELIRHDVVEPILLEVDQIYHLACPASPVHYKYNPVKTIISLLIDSKTKCKVSDFVKFGSLLSLTVITRQM
ncbi:unnamed protein product, partial [Vitis vinifera]